MYIDLPLPKLEHVTRDTSLHRVSYLCAIRPWLHHEYAVRTRYVRGTMCGIISTLYAELQAIGLQRCKETGLTKQCESVVTERALHTSMYSCTSCTQRFAFASLPGTHQVMYRGHTLHITRHRSSSFSPFLRHRGKKTLKTLLRCYTSCRELCCSSVPDKE